MYKRQTLELRDHIYVEQLENIQVGRTQAEQTDSNTWLGDCLLYTSDAADERSSVDLGGRRILKKKTGVREPGDCGNGTKTDRISARKTARLK